MGNWNRRYQPRKKFRHYEYEDPPLSPPRNYNTHSYSSGIEDNRVPSWEIDYCNSARVPWHKILASKKYIYCYPSVLNWDASAGEEALQDAKQRYWARINGLPYNDPLPNSDMYIDEIDWDPHMDLELMAELDLPVFDPDKAQNVEKLETVNEEVECTQAQHDKNQSNGNNPWERSNVQGTESLKDAVKGWGTWGDTVNLKNENPWEQSCSEHVDNLKDNAWRGGNDSWSWYQGSENNNNSRSSAFVDNGYGNSCNYNNPTMTVRQEGWGCRENNSWNWDSRGFKRAGRSFRGGGRKRESSIQHTSKFKSSRYHGDTYGNSHRL